MNLLNLNFVRVYHSTFDLQILSSNHFTSKKKCVSLTCFLSSFCRKFHFICIAFTFERILNNQSWKIHAGNVR